jgi:hypothetical protein
MCKNVLWENGLLSTHIIIRVAVPGILVSVGVAGFRLDGRRRIAGRWGHVDVVRRGIVGWVVGWVLVVVYGLGWRRWEVVALWEVARVSAVDCGWGAITRGGVGRVFVFCSLFRQRKQWKVYLLTSSLLFGLLTITALSRLVSGQTSNASNCSSLSCLARTTLAPTRAPVPVPSRS